MTIQFDNGNVQTKLTVKAAQTGGGNGSKNTAAQPVKGSAPKTGDDNNAGVWLAFMALCGFGLGGAVITDKKRRTTGKR